MKRNNFQAKPGLSPFSFGATNIFGLIPRLLLSIILLVAPYISLGFPQVKIVENSHYLLPEFTKGLVLMKSGIRNEVFLNYNTITEEMIFDNKGVKQAMYQLDLIDTVFIEGRKFIPFDSKFVEDVYLGKSELYVEYKCSINDPGKPAAYGGTSRTSATTTYSSYFANGQLYQMKLPEGLETRPYIEYWLKKNGKAIKFLNIRQLSKMFEEDKSDSFKDYIKKHQVKYTDQKSIIDLIKHMESI
jgi:hypothetical protein